MEELFLKILNMSITASYCALVVLILRMLLRKLPKVYSYALWAVVYFRMACPVSIQSVFSLLRVRPQTIPEDVEVWGRAQVHTAAREQMAQLGVTDITETAQAVSGTGSINPLQMALSVAAVVWILGAALLVAHSVWSLFRLWRELAGAQAAGWNIYEAENLQTPFVFGLFRPRIYLPAHLTEPERSLVLAHERTHIHRKDYLIKQAAFLITCVYWFNPLAWLSFYFMCRDMEMSCDESVIRGMGGGVKEEYSKSLLALASGRQIVNGSPLAFGEGGIRARITNVLYYRRPAFWVSMIFVAVLSVVLVGLALNPVEAAPAEEEMPVSVTDRHMAAKDVTLAGGEYDEKILEDSYSYAVAYDGYLDESPFSLWNQDWNNCDFDADGLRDRIYRTCSAEDLSISYRIEFGNGLELTVGEFEDCFTGLVIESADLTGNGEREILYVGMHGASTDPTAESEIALFTKAGDRYVQVPLPKPEYADPLEEYIAGYSGLYFRDNGDGTVRLVAPQLGYEETFALSESELEYWEADYWGPSEEVGGPAYDASFITYNGERCLALFTNPGSKFYYHPVCFVLRPVPQTLSISPYEMELVDMGLVEDTGLTEYDFSRQERSFAGMSAESAGTGNPNEAREGLWQGRSSVGIPAHRSGFVEPTLHLYVPSNQSDPDYVNLDAMPEEEYRQLAVDALQDLYDLTGTQIEECCYYYNTLGIFWFGRTEDDMEHQRMFYHRSYGGTEAPEFGSMMIGTMSFANARRVWFSDVYQYGLPADFDSYTDSERAVWFLQHSGLYEGETVAECVQPYPYVPETWQIRMVEGTAYEITLDNAIDSVADIAGPYPNWDIGH